MASRHSPSEIKLLSLLLKSRSRLMGTGQLGYVELSERCSKDGGDVFSVSHRVKHGRATSTLLRIVSSIVPIRVLSRSAGIEGGQLSWWAIHELVDDSTVLSRIFNQPMQRNRKPMRIESTRPGHGEESDQSKGTGSVTSISSPNKKHVRPASLLISLNSHI